MIVGIIYGEYLQKIREDGKLKEELAKANGVRVASIEARLRPQASGLPHALNLTNVVNMKIIAEALNLEAYELYSEQSIEIKK